MNRQKIALTGPSGSGKTTLAKHISEVMGYPFISTSAGDILTIEDKSILKEKYLYEGKGHENVISLSSRIPSFGLDFQNMVANARGSIILNNDGFIIDRSPIDNLVYFMLQCSHNQSPKVFEIFREYCRKIIKELDIIIWVRTCSDSVEDNKSRIPNIHFQRMVDSLFKYAIEEHFFLELKDFNPEFYVIDTWDWEYRKNIIKEIF
jgi:energy-coupling factor transporter ATP-binding protein EcfA2